MKNKILAALIAILAFGQGAWAAENGWEITSSTSNGVTTFTISRTNTAVAETVKYRFVNLSAFAGQHYNVTKVNGANSSALTGEFTFAAGDATSRTIQVTEQGASTNAYNYQIGTSRSYKLELTDAGGFYLTKNQRSFTTGTSVNSSNVYAEQSVTVASGPVTITHDGFDQGYHAVSMSTYFSNAAPQAYLVAAGAELRMVVTLDEAEKDDGYQHIQLLVNKTTSFDDSASEGNPGTPTYSHYLASFAHKPGSTLTTYASVCFPLTSATDNCSAVDAAWNFSPYNNTVGKLYTQKFKSGYRASDGKLIVAKKSELNGLSTVGIRFDASGDNADTWYAKNVTAKFTAVDETAPTVLAFSLAPGYHARGNTVYVSVAFSEIVTTSSAKLTSSWGDLSYVAGSSTNVLTFSRTIPESASGALSITGYSGIADLAGNAPSSVNSNNLCSLDASYAYTITYDLDGGSVATENPATYHYGTASFTLNNPIKPGYSFDGWTGSNGSTPSTTVTIANHSHGNKTYTANWTPITYTLRLHHNDGTNNYTDLAMTYDQAKTIQGVSRTGFTITGWSNSPTGAVVYTDGQSVSNLTTTNGATIDLYAQWTINTYSVHFNANGGSGEMTNEQFTYGESKALTANVFTREGYTFAGWSTTTNGDVVYADGQEVSNLTTTNGATIDLYAKWTAHTYTVHFDANGGTGNMVDEPFTYGEAKALTANAFTLEGYTFAGWSTTANGAVVYTDGQSVSNLTATNGATVTLYANWTPLWGQDSGATGDDEAHPYIISSTAGLDLLAKMVNGTDGYTANDFNGKFFKLSNDITYAHTTAWDNASSTENNFTAIGRLSSNTYYYFRGTFDGDNHTISGIRIYKKDYNAADSYQGLFGFVDASGTVKNVTLSDTRIAGHTTVGTISGRNNGVVINCHAAATVVISAVTYHPSNYHGGIVGNNNGGTIRCTSAARLTSNLQSTWYYGAIAGQNTGSVENCLAVGASIPGTEKYYGVIAGYNYGGTLTNNYYRNCTVGATANATNVGVGNGSGAPADQDGARSVHELALPAGVTATGESVEISSSTYYAAGTTVTLSYSNIPDGGSVMYQVNGTAIDGNSFTMPGQDVTITAQLTSTVSYIDADGTEKSAIAIPITESQTEYGTDGETNWYVVSGEVNLGKLFFWDDETHLILEDGARLTIYYNYYNEQLTNGALSAGNITIYGQSNGTGQLIAESAPSGYSVGIQTKTIIINSGNIIVTAMKYGIYTSDSSITINGGSVTATRFDANGSGLYSNSDITINGGNVNSIGAHGGNGIFASGSIVINGGSVKTSASKGIYGRNITITDGNVEASGTGSGIYTYGGNVTIDGGNVTATGGNNGGRGIYAQRDTKGGEITINGGIVEANGGNCGIYGSPIQLAGGTVTASKYSGTVSIKSGLKYTDGTTIYTGSLNPDKRTAIAGKTMTPYVAPSPNLTLVQGTKDGVTAYWGTFYDSGSGYTLPAGAAAYTMDADYHLYRLGTYGSVIPKGTAVVIMADQATISLTTSDDAQATDNAPGGNILVGRDASVVIDGIYVLGINASGAVGFYPLSGIALPAHKAGYVPKVGGLQDYHKEDEQQW